MAPNLFCHSHPIGKEWDDPHTIKVRISKSSQWAFDALPRGAEYQTRFIRAFDRISNKWVAVRRFPCGSGCYCAAQAQFVETPKSPVKWEPIEMSEGDEIED